MSFDEYLSLVDDSFSANPTWRLGQTAYNVLTWERPRLAELLPTDLDPFHRDDRLDEFYCWLRVNW